MEWTPWDGKRDFRGDKLLSVKFRNGSIAKTPLPASKWRGRWGGKFPKDYEFDIVAVSVVG